MSTKILGILLTWLSVWSCGASAKQSGMADGGVNEVNLEFKVPSKLKATAIELHSLENKAALLSKSLDNVSGKVQLKDTLSSEDTYPMVAFIQMDDGSLWTARLEKDGSFEPLRYEESAPKADIQAEYIRQHRMPVASGEYSGITHVKDDVYALVHDKSTGGGIHLFNIPIDNAGVVGTIQAKEVPGNSGKEGGKDNEDIVYVPASNTLYVSAESDQSVREYTVEGEATGRTLEVPEDLKAIQPNAGFESLAYDAERGFFWAATEKSLQEEGLHSSIIRLQRISGSNPDARYLYMLSQPLATKDQVASASAYVHGLSAMTVLEDGRLIMLEREVYVPGGSIIDKALGAFTLSNLYVVDPLNDKGGILEKKLLTRVVTSALNLANYEGMCLGPKLSGGRQALLLIADSQNGQGGLTGEYLQILAIK
ncbi:MAG: esterase-like activity of phytase family protein [Bacteroidales bacterium]|nr:esterase-like activity of phytase family protein [Bacteroidales bacterium]